MPGGGLRGLCNFWLESGWPFRGAIFVDVDVVFIFSGNHIDSLLESVADYPSSVGAVVLVVLVDFF